MQEQKEFIVTSLEYLSALCLESSETHNGYTEQELHHAVLIFSHVLSDVMYTKNKDKIDFARHMELAHNTGKAIRELIKAATGVDMHKFAK